MYHAAFINNYSSVILRFILFSLFFAPSAFTREGVEMHFRGELNAKLVIYMRLALTPDDSVHGDYLYLTSGKTVPLRGTIKNGKCNITEFNDSTHPTKPSGRFIGGFKELEFTGGYKQVKLSGMWLSRDSSIFFRFELTRSGPIVETVKTRKILSFPPSDTASSDSVVVVKAFAPKITTLGDEKITQKVNAYLDSVMSEYSYDDTLLYVGQENRYAIHYITDNILSISSGGLDFSRGHAHPNFHSISATLNLKTGKPLRIKDCFKPSALKKMNALLLDAFIRCIGNGEGFDITLKPTSENFTVNAFEITFDLTNCLPHAIQSCAKISIPLKDLVPFIDPKGPFKIFLVLM